MRIWLVACLVLAFVAASPRDVAAQPVSFALQGDVAAGQKPQLKVTATEKITDIKVELARNDGKSFKLAHAGLAKGETVSLAIGDGAAGKASYKGTLSAAVASGKRWTEELIFDTIVRGGALKITYDADHLDLDKRVLQFKASRPAASAELVVITDDGKELAKQSTSFTDASADAWLSINWTQPADTRVMMLKLRVATADGTATNVELIPWSVTVEHEDVNFATDSAKLEPSETKKLDAALVKIKEVVKRSEKYMKMRLYVAGHTDTVGPTAKNRKLSLDRALAIASYFKKQGVGLPITFAGFGEEVLKVKTADNTDEARNRRADYVIGPAAGAPPFKGPYLKVKPAWKQLK